MRFKKARTKKCEGVAPKTKHATSTKPAALVRKPESVCVVYSLIDIIVFSFGGHAKSRMILYDNDRPAPRLRPQSHTAPPLSTVSEHDNLRRHCIADVSYTKHCIPQIKTKV